MKKYIAVILLIGIALGSVLFYNTKQVNERAYKSFSDSGYVLQSKEENQNEVERYYFGGDQKYKENYNEKITFEDTNGEEVTSDKNNYIHYTNGSISAFKRGVLVDLTTVESDPIFYYSIAANSTLTKNGDSYKIKNLDKELTFNYLLWKIDTNKYLVAGKGLRLALEDGSEKVIDGFVEFEYCDNEVVRIYNQELMYQTISDQTVLHVTDDVRINLVTKVISKGEENQMSLETMAIDSEDNIPIVDLNEEEESEENANEVDSETVVNQGGNGNSDSNTVTNNNSQTINNEQNSSTANGTGGTGEDIVPDNPTVIKTPKFKVSEFNVSSTVVDATIDITDADNLLNQDTNIKIFRTSSGTVDFEQTYALGQYHIEFDTHVLLPNTEYVMQVESAYQVDDIAYQKNFIYKQFRTPAIGIGFEKDIFTNTSMGFKVKFERDSKITRATLKVFSENDKENVLYSEEVLNTDLNAGSEVTAMFTDLAANTTYEIRLTDIMYDGSIYTNRYDISKYFKTLKDAPIIVDTVLQETDENGDPVERTIDVEVDFEVNKKDPSFLMKITGIEDRHSAIEKYRFEVYDSRITDGAPVKTIETTETEAPLMVDGTTIQKDIGYNFKVIAIYNDNEKIRECQSIYSAVMTMTGAVYPVVSFVEDPDVGITFERIKGTLIITDDFGTIDIEHDVVTVECSDRYGRSVTSYSQGSLRIPIDINNLRSNETYLFLVKGTVDLDDGNGPMSGCTIGTISLTTKLPEPLIASFSAVDTTVDGVDSDCFNTNFQLTLANIYDDLEAQTLTKMKISIYEGKTGTDGLPNGTLVKTVSLVDGNTEPYESDLKNLYYNDMARITPQLFGMQNTDFSKEYYTVVVNGGEDYTDYPNSLPIIDNVHTIRTNRSLSDHISDTPFKEITLVRNGLAGEAESEELDYITYVQAKVTADYTEQYATKIFYKAVDCDTNTVVETIELPCGENGEIPTATFNIGAGTHYTTSDSVENGGMKRGNRYYFTYHVEVDLNEDGEITEGEIYPTGDLQYDTGAYRLRSAWYTLTKQEPRVNMYTSSSTPMSRTYKYNVYDIDNTLITPYMLLYLNGDTEYTEMKQISVNTNVNNTDFQTVTFENLEEDDMKILLEYATKKYQPITTTPDDPNAESEDENINELVLVNEYFESEIDISNLRYNVTPGANAVVIQIADQSGETYDITNMDKVIAFKVIFKDAETEEVLQTFNHKTFSESNSISINYTDIASLINKKVKICLQAWYDSGRVGYDMTSEYVIFQEPYLKSEQPQYYILNQELNLSKTSDIKWYMYIQHREDTDPYNLLKIESALTNQGAQNTFELELSESGFNLPKDQESLINKKLVNLSGELVANGEDKIEFDLIIPGIDFTDESKNINIQEMLQKIKMQARIINTGNAIIKDDNIYIEFYRCNQNYTLKETTPFAEVVKKVSDFDSAFEIGSAQGVELDPGECYAMRFYANIETDEGINKKYLYDIVYNTDQRYYYFSMLDNVGLKIVNAYYDPDNYSEKYVKVEYTLEEVSGFYCEYKLLKNVSGSWVDSGISIPTQSIFSTNNTLPIATPPGTNSLDFGTQYKIQIIPKGVLEDGTIEILGDEEYTFTLATLEKPIIGIRGSRTAGENGTSNIVYKISIYDTDRIVVNGTYTLEIYDDRQEDVTPDHIKSATYNIEDLNNTVTFYGADIQKEYTMKVILNVDYDNKANNIKQLTKEYVVSAGNEYNVNMGNISVSGSTKKEGALDFTFTGADNIEGNVDIMKYTIYNTSGYNYSGQISFSPTVTMTSDGEYIYSVTLDNGEDNLKDSGTYTAVLQFIKNSADGEILLESREIEFGYISNDDA